jgi:CheY-like chemotaxis protein
MQPNNPNQFLKILIADDDEDDRQLTAMAFQEATLQHEISFVKNGDELMSCLYTLSREGLEKLPDLILLDLNMPKKDGRVALREIKQDPSLQRLNVVIFSTSISDEDKVYTMNLGASSYITKPSGFYELVQIIRNVCGTIYS